MDLLQEAITMEPRYSRNVGSTTRVLFSLRDSLLDIIKVRYGSWHRAWIIGGYPNSFDRNLLINKHGVTEVVFMDVSQDECLERLDKVSDERFTNRNDWIKYIDDWFKQYTPPSNSE